MSFLRVAVTFVLAAYIGAAQPLPDARTLYNRAQAITKSFHSLQFALDMTLEAGFPSAPIHMTVSIT